MRRLPLPVPVQIPVALTVVALLLAALFGTLTGSTASPAPAQRVTTAPVTATTVVCPDIDGTPTGTSTRAAVADVAGLLTPASTSSGGATTTILAGPKSTPTSLAVSPAAVVSSVASKSETIAVSAHGSLAATLAADQVGVTPSGRYRALTGVRCEQPSTDWWFAGADGRVGFTDDLLLANPGSSAVNVSIGLWGVKGPLSAIQVQTLRVNALSTQLVKIASIAADDATVTVHVHATSGAVTAALLDRRTSALLALGGDFIPATAPPARTSVIAGYTAGTGRRYVYLTNPGTTDATLTLKVVTQSGTFIPTGDAQLGLRAGRTTVLRVDHALAGATGAVEVTSDEPLVSQGLVVSTSGSQRPDLMWLAATHPIVGTAAVADGRQLNGGHTLLALTAPEGAATVQVTSGSGQSQTVSVPAGHSVSVDITKTVQSAQGLWPFVVTPTGDAPVYGVRVLELTGAHGPLITGEPLVGLPQPIPLPPVREDLTVAAH